MNAPLISIVIPVKNGDSWLENLFAGLETQTLFHECEIIVIDSGSTDNSLQICKKHNVSVYSISPQNFNHGLTRNLGLKYAKGKFILMTVQDAVPEKKNFLELLVECLEDGNTAGVCGMQIVPEKTETNPFHWHRPLETPKINCYQFQQPWQFDKLTPEEKMQICCWDDVCAMYTREALSEIPFREVLFGEDMAWCVDALRKGYRICYQPAAKVFHYHLDEPRYIYRRTINELYSYYNNFRYIPVEESNLITTLKSVKLIILEGKIPFRKKLYWFRKQLQSKKISQEAIHHFLKYQQKGDEELYKFYSAICNLPDQAPKGKLA